MLLTSSAVPSRVNHIALSLHGEMGPGFWCSPATCALHGRPRQRVPPALHLTIHSLPELFESIHKTDNFPCQNCTCERMSHALFKSPDIS